MKLSYLTVIVAFLASSSIAARAATRWTPKSADDSEKSISLIYAPSQEIEIEFDDSGTEDVDLEFFGLGIDLGSFYVAGASVSDWGDEVSDADGFGVQAGFKQEVYSADALSMDLDIKGLYLDLSSDEVGAEYNELTAGVVAKYFKEKLVFWGGLDVVLHSDLEADYNYYSESIDGEADSRINFIIGVGYQTDSFIADAGVGLFGYEGLMLSAGLKF